MGVARTIAICDDDVVEKITLCDIDAVKQVIILPLAAKALRQHRADAARILQKIDAYAARPASAGKSVKALQGSTALRLRVGDYRVIFEETATEIIITKIGPRGSVYD